MQRDVEALIPVVEFIPLVSENSPCLNELHQLANAKSRIAFLSRVCVRDWCFAQRAA